MVEIDVLLFCNLLDLDARISKQQEEEEERKRQRRERKKEKKVSTIILLNEFVYHAN